MKIRYFVAGYTLVMLLLLSGLLSAFKGDAGGKAGQSGRDMVYYNEQQILIQQEIEKGTPIRQIEEDYACDILLCSDEKYEILLQEALRQEALVVDYFKEGALAGKIIWNEAARHYENMEKSLFQKILVIWALLFLGGWLFQAFLYIRIVRPFYKLQNFSRQIAKGNLDFPLPAGKHDYFGAFTESFDLMREELKRARESEYQANKSKKELMAELSHDIKTPVATIQATCEVLQLKESNPDTLEKVTLIDGKARMIHQLVDNLFHATLEELTVLKVEPVGESSLCIADMFSDLEYYGELKQRGDIPRCLVYMDKLRLQQVIDNCLHNAWKYAATPVEVSFQEQKEGIRILIKDEGKGVCPEELPLIREKFYRGSNAKGKEGSGLGLYLAKLFMEQMKGGLECYNDNGFVVELFLRKV